MSGSQFTQQVQSHERFDVFVDISFFHSANVGSDGVFRYWVTQARQLVVRVTYPGTYGNETRIEAVLRLVGLWFASLFVSAILELGMLIVVFLVLPLQATLVLVTYGPTALSALKLSEQIGLTNNLPEWVSFAHLASRPFALLHDLSLLGRIAESGHKVAGVGVQLMISAFLKLATAVGQLIRRR